MRVFRIQSKQNKKQGPYHATAHSNRKDNLNYIFNHSYPSHPALIDDFRLCAFTEKLFCGFTSIEKYKEWFSLDDREILEIHGGFDLIEYEIDSSFVKHSKTGKQLIMYLDAAIEIQKHPLV